MSEETEALPPIHPESAGPIRQFFRDLVDCLTEPRRFFSERFPKISFTYALAFGLIVYWISAVLGWLTRVVQHQTLLDGLLKMRDQLQQLPFWRSLPADIWAQNPERLSMFPAWLAEVFGLALNPFGTLLHFVINGLIIWIGAMILVPKDSTRDPVTLANLVKLVALAAVPELVGAILGFLPFGLGMLISNVYAFVLLMIAISIRYRVSYLRSFAIIALPGFLGLMVFGCIVTVVSAMVFGTFAAFFHVH